MKSLTIITPQDPVTKRLETKPNSRQLNNSIVTFPKFATPNARILSAMDRRVRGPSSSFHAGEARGIVVHHLRRLAHEISRGQVLTSLEPEASLYFNRGGQFSRGGGARAWSVTRDTPNSWAGSAGPRRRRRSTKSAPVSPKPLPIPN